MVTTEAVLPAASTLETVVRYDELQTGLRTTQQPAPPGGRTWGAHDPTARVLFRGSLMLRADPRQLPSPLLPLCSRPCHPCHCGFMLTQPRQKPSCCLFVCLFLGIVCTRQSARLLLDLPLPFAHIVWMSREFWEKGRDAHSTPCRSRPECQPRELTGQRGLPLVEATKREF